MIVVVLLLIGLALILAMSFLIERHPHKERWQAIKEASSDAIGRTFEE